MEESNKKDLTVTFDTYKRHSPTFWLARVMVFSPILLFVYLFWCNLDINVFNIPGCIISVVVLATCCFIGAQILITPSMGRLYRKTGNITIAENHITADDRTYEIGSPTNKIRLQLMGYRGQWQGSVDQYMGGESKEENGLGNRICLYENDKVVLEKLFVLTTLQDLEQLKSILVQWKQNGIKLKILGDEVYFKGYKYVAKKTISQKKE